jgi:2-keto-4-pentenoate hydratase/2-oxohepta-3-ene-1,7-dioic acid hydratase in catechol pathway
VIIALAYNYKGYEHPPIFFLKRGLIEDGDQVHIPNDLDTWIEPELGWIVGYGFVLANDITTDCQVHDVHLAPSKCRDTYCPMTLIEKPENPSNVTLRGYINGKLVTEGNTGQRIYDEAGAYKYISQYMKLKEKDVILTGCPPHDRPLVKDGDVSLVQAWEGDRLLGSLANDICS